MAAVGPLRPTTGGFAVTVSGADFSTIATVTVSGLPCTVQQCANDTVVCVAPPRRIDTPAAVVVTVDGQRSDTTAVLAYDAPVVDGTSPTLADARAASPTRAAVNVHGRNFGARVVAGHTVAALPLVFVSGAACASVQWPDDDLLVCTLPTVDLPVGPQNVTVAVQDDVSAVFTGLALECDAGYYGDVGQYCKPCPAGAVCNGGGDEPIALPGFFRADR